jgi:hypothetical protein
MQFAFITDDSVGSFVVSPIVKQISHVYFRGGEISENAIRLPASGPAYGKKEFYECEKI